MKGEPVLTPTEARQASPRRLNLRVLVGSMLMAVIVAAILYYLIYENPNSPIGMPKQPPPEPGAASETTPTPQQPTAP